MSNKSFRDVGPVIKFLRKKMVGVSIDNFIPFYIHIQLTIYEKCFVIVYFQRDLPNPLRFEPNYANRTQPDPELPDGPSHRLFGNYYYSRDARRKVETPLQLVGPEELKKLSDPGLVFDF